jgi:hypothetical protein
MSGRNAIRQAWMIVYPQASEMEELKAIQMKYS